MMSYSHLAHHERYQIYVLRKAGSSQQKIARLLGRHPSTISRELRRNQGQRGYRPRQAQLLSEQRARVARTRPRITTRQWRSVARLLRLQWSPQQIAERAELEASLAISHETIYRYVYADKSAGGDLWRQLRVHKRYRKRYGSGRERRGRMPGRVGIEQRPVCVERRDRIGHWEADTVHGCRRRGAVLSLVERRSRLTRLAKLPRATANAVRDAATRCLRPLADQVTTITADNGREFAGHREIASRLGTDFYFADPYASWQRGTNENTNGLIRQYLPKSRSLTTLSAAEIRKIEQRLNHRPRKCLGYLTPHEVFNNTRVQLTVALRG